MKGKDVLVELIQSLNASEKRYLKLYASRQVKGEQNKYMQVFAALETMPENGGKSLNEFLKSLTGTRQVSRIKTYLKDLILKSLTAYHSESIVENKVREILSMVEVLIKKHLLEQASRQLDKAEKLAEEHELFLALLEINHIRLRIHVNHPSTKEANQLIQGGKQHIRKTFSQWQNLWSYDAHAVALHVRTLRNGYNLKVLQFPQIPLLNNLAEAQSLRARIKFHRIHSSYLIQQNSFDAAISHLQAQVAAFEERPQMLSHRLSNYFSTLRNLVLTSRLAKQYPLAIQVADKLRKQLPLRFGEKLTQLNINAQIASINSCLDLEKEIGDLNSTLPRLPAFDSALKKFAANIEPIHKMSYCYLSGVICFLAEDYREAARRFYKITAQPEGKIRNDLLRYARFMLLLAHYSMQQFDVFENELRSTLRFIKQQTSIYKLENVLCELLKAMLKFPKGSASLRRIFQNCLEQFQELENDAYERMAMHYFDFKAFVESQLSGTSIVEVLKIKQQTQPQAGL